MNFWTRISRIIIKQRFLILLLLGLATFFMFSQIKHMRFSYEEANLLPKDHEINLQYNKFLDLFGEEGNVIVIAVKDSTFFTSDGSWYSLFPNNGGTSNRSLLISPIKREGSLYNSSPYNIRFVDILKHSTFLARVAAT